jgi:hypothetical protein
MTAVAAIIGTGGVALGLFIAGYGLRAGLIQKRILRDHRGKFETGRSAQVRGAFYVLLGSLIAGGGAFTLAAVWVRVW